MREKEEENRWLVVADGRSTVIVPGNRKCVITSRIEWKIVRRCLTASACMPECVPLELLQQFQPKFTFHERGNAILDLRTNNDSQSLTLIMQV